MYFAKQMASKSLQISLKRLKIKNKLFLLQFDIGESVFQLVKFRLLKLKSTVTEASVSGKILNLLTELLSSFGMMNTHFQFLVDLVLLGLLNVFFALLLLGYFLLKNSYLFLPLLDIVITFSSFLDVSFRKLL